MAVYTHVSDTALEGFLKNYDLGQFVSLKGIEGGVENTNYLLTMEKERYILTLYEQRVDAKDLPFFMGLMEHLAQKGFACPLPIKDKTGNALGQLAGRPAAMVSFLEGGEEKNPTANHGYIAGQTMARLHLDAQDFSIKRVNALAPHGWPKLAQASAAGADTVEAGLAALIANELTYAQSHWPQDIPTGVIHADMFRDNVFFQGRELSGVIDFYFACNDFLAYDLAIALNAWCFDEALQFVPSMAKALVDGYQSVRPLEGAEIKALPILVRGAALRFLLTRTYDWLNVPEGAVVKPHDPTAFSRRLRFFQTADPQTYGAA